MKASRLAVVIEDDADIRQVIVTLLEATGLEVYSAGNGKDGVAAVRKHNPDVVTLDLSLPDIDGIEVAHRIRAFSDAYIVMLTARATEVATLQGLASGADDYVTKPFRPRELRARVETLLRRPRGGVTPPTLPVSPPALPPAAPPAVHVTAAPVKETTTAAGPPDKAHPASPLGSARPAAAAGRSGSAAPSGSDGPPLEHNGLVLDACTRTAAVKDAEVPLTRTEFDLLHALMEGGRTVRTTAGLARRLRMRDYDTGQDISESEERAVQVHIANLRRKLGDSPQAPKWVETVRGVGYRMAPKSSIAP